MNHPSFSRILPVLRGNYPDPTILRVGADYYLTHSSGCDVPALLLWHSTDLLNWTPLQAALPHFDGDIWAPELCHHQGRFFIYYPTSGGNHVIWADVIEGPWSEPIDLKVGHIDPGHLLAPDGKRYLFLSTGHMVELAPDGLSTRGEVQKVHEGWAFPASWRTEGYCLESPKSFVRGMWIYLISAQGGTAGPATSHMATVARSRSPFGPWEESPHNPLIHTASNHEPWWSRGHGTVFEAHDGQWWIIYHAYENGYRTLGRHNLLEPITWTSDGWPVIDQERDLGAVPAAALGTLPMSDDFSRPELGWQWRFHNEKNAGRAQVGSNSLRLQASGTSAADASPPLCLAPQHRAYLVEVEIELQNAGEAGLLLFYDAKCFAGVGLDDKGIFLARPDRNLLALSAPGQTRATLRIVNDHHDVELWARLEGQTWQQLSVAFETSAWHHNVLGGYNSLRVGLYCAGEGAAQFRGFRYQPLDSP